MFATFHNPISFILSSEVQFLRTFHEKKRNAFERRFSLAHDEDKSFPPPTQKKKICCEITMIQMEIRSYHVTEEQWWRRTYPGHYKFTTDHLYVSFHSGCDGQLMGI